MLAELINEINNSQTVNLDDCNMYDFVSESEAIEGEVSVGDLVHDNGVNGAAFVYAIDSKSVSFLHNGRIIRRSIKQAEKGIVLVARFSASVNEAQFMAVAVAAL